MEDRANNMYTQDRASEDELGTRRKGAPSTPSAQKRKAQSEARRQQNRVSSQTYRMRLQGPSVYAL